MTTWVPSTLHHTWDWVAKHGLSLVTRHRRASESRLLISNELWSELIHELGARGQGRKESGAFLLGPRDGDPRRVTNVVYLDDLDPNCLTGGISFDGRYYGILWDYCHTHGLQVRADIHTHPGPSVAQSYIDRDNPMVSRAGHLGLIVPNLATRPIAANEVGVHEFLGAEGWRSSFEADATALLTIER
jgi:proteasome lid subunit RPN8/RPN11